jgi:hypothetical protein
MINIEFDNQNDVFTTYVPTAARSVARTNKADAKKLLRKEAAAEILTQCGGLPKTGCSIEIITNGQSNAGGFYEVIRDIWGKVDTLCIATWIINKDYIDMLFADLDSGKLNNLVFLISNRMSQLGKGHGPNFNVLKTKAMSHPRCEFRVANSHAKVYVMTNEVDYITISGSGNWSENPRIENYTITNDKERFLFHQSWMLEVAKSKQ